MKRIWHHYTLWEDWQAGMYRGLRSEESETLPGRCKELLNDCDSLYVGMMRVIDTWIIAAEFHLSNIAFNRQAWLGRAACCLEHDAPLEATQIAWHLLSWDAQCRANAVADGIISEWESRYAHRGTLWENVV